MNILNKYLSLLLVCLPIVVISQTERTSQQSLRVLIQVDRESEAFFFTHYIQPGETFYGLSRTYKVSTDDLMNLNKRLDLLDIRIGTPIRIPLNVDIISERQEYPDQQALYYVVQPKETLYRIAKSYFDQDIEHIKEINNLSNNNLSINQQVLIGYLPPHTNTRNTPIAISSGQSDPKTKAQQEKKTKPIVRIDEHGMVYFDFGDNDEKDKPNKKSYEFNSTGGKIIDKNGTAYWNKSDYDSKGYFALHRSAKKNSIIEITNPMTNITINAKVIGELPYNLYGPEIDLVVSPDLARDLKVLDAKFFVHMKYLVE